MRARWLIPVALLGFGVAVVPALGANQSVQAGPGVQYSPNEIAVKPGETVTFSNAGGFHSVVVRQRDAVQRRHGRQQRRAVELGLERDRDLPGEGPLHLPLRLPRRLDDGHRQRQRRRDGAGLERDDPDSRADDDLADSTTPTGTTTAPTGTTHRAGAGRDRHPRADAGQPVARALVQGPLRGHARPDGLRARQDRRHAAQAPGARLEGPLQAVRHAAVRGPHRRRQPLPVHQDARGPRAPARLLPAQAHRHRRQRHRSKTKTVSFTVR